MNLKNLEYNNQYISQLSQQENINKKNQQTNRFDKIYTKALEKFQEPYVEKKYRANQNENLIKTQKFVKQLNHRKRIPFMDIKNTASPQSTILNSQEKKFIDSQLSSIIKKNSPNNDRYDLDIQCIQISQFDIDSTPILSKKKNIKFDNHEYIQSESFAKQQEQIDFTQILFNGQKQQNSFQITENQLINSNNSLKIKQNKMNQFVFLLVLIVTFMILSFQIFSQKNFQVSQKYEFISLNERNLYRSIYLNIKQRVQMENMVQVEDLKNEIYEHFGPELYSKVWHYVKSFQENDQDVEHQNFQNNNVWIYLNKYQEV